MSWLKYSNQGATRSQPLSHRLVEALSFLPELGIGMEVFSGGQPSSGPNRVGSHRHDEGGAGDVFFTKGGRRLDWRNPEDVPTYQEIVRRAKERGVTGVGAGEGYMQPGSVHIGFGPEATWGAGGSGSNTPAWLREAFGGAGGAVPTGSKPYDLPATGGNTLVASGPANPVAPIANAVADLGTPPDQEQPRRTKIENVPNPPSVVPQMPMPIAAAADPAKRAQLIAMLMRQGGMA
jgi:hypothetical protein